MNYIEEQPWGITSYDVEDSICFFTEIQRVEFITNPHFGRMMFLDGVLQSSTYDEHIYHQALVSAGMTNSTRSVLIAGGAEGAVAREVLKWPVSRVKMVDWDSELVKHCYKVEKFNTSAFEDPRFSYTKDDITEFCVKNTEKFDTMFLDLLDIDNEDNYETMKYIVDYLRHFCRDYIVMNVGRDYTMAKRFGEVISVTVPSFQEPWYLAKIILCQ